MKELSVILIYYSLPANFRSNSDRKTYQEQYHRRVKQSCQPTQTIFLVQKSHLVFLFYSDSNLYDPYECIRSQINDHSKKPKLNDCIGIPCTIAVNFSIVKNLNPFLYLVGVSKFDSFNTWIALHVTPIPLRTPLKQTKAPELKFNISNSDTTV